MKPFDWVIGKVIDICRKILFTNKHMYDTITVIEMFLVTAVIILYLPWEIELIKQYYAKLMGKP